MRPVVIGDAVLYNCDCREVLPTMEAEGCLITDPPYGMAYTSGYATDDLWDGREIQGDKSTELRDFVLQWADNIPALCFGTWRVQRPAKTKIVLIWDKGGALGMGDLRIPWKCDHEEIYVLGSGFIGMRDKGSVLRFPPVQSMAKNGRNHPNEKPVALLHDLARKTPGKIHDTFMGSGSMGVAAVEAGRPFVGFEVSPRYFDIACQRIETAVAQGRLFAPQPPEPVQELMFGERASAGKE